MRDNSVSGYSSILQVEQEHADLLVYQFLLRVCNSLLVLTRQKLNSIGIGPLYRLVNNQHLVEVGVGAQQEVLDDVESVVRQRGNSQDVGSC